MAEGKHTGEGPGADEEGVARQQDEEGAGKHVVCLLGWAWGTLAVLEEGLLLRRCLSPAPADLLEQGVCSHSQTRPSLLPWSKWKFHAHTLHSQRAPAAFGVLAATLLYIVPTL